LVTNIMCHIKLTKEYKNNGIKASSKQ